LIEAKAKIFGLTQNQVEYTVVDTSRKQDIETVVKRTNDTFGSIYALFNNEEFQRENAKTSPLGRYGSAEEIARLVVFLCSEANTYITGQSILVDGGMVQAY